VDSSDEKNSHAENGDKRSNDSDDSFLDAALRLAAEEFQLFPLCAGQKFPPPKGWREMATSDAARIKEWAAATIDDLLPQPNIGIATGNGLLVVDVDPRNGGDASVADLKSTYGELPRTRTVHTAGGGLHFYFKVPLDRAIRNNNRGKLGKGVDLKSDGGYVVAPPSVTEKGAYRWDDPDVSIADAPVWLLDLAATQRASEQQENSDAGSTAETPKHELTLSEVRKLARHLDPDCDYDSWTQNILWPLYRIGLGAQDGSNINEWIALGDEVSRGALLDPPRTPDSYPGFEVTRGKMLEAAKQPGYGLKHFLDVVKAAGAKPPPNVSDIDDFEPVSYDPGASPPAPPTGFPKIVFRELRDDLYSNPPLPREFVLGGYLPKRAASKFSGPGQLGKSMLMLYGAYCQATGRQFCGHSCTPQRVIYLSAEDEFEEFERRIHRIQHELYPSSLPPPDVRELLRHNLLIVDLVDSGTDALLTSIDRKGHVAITPFVEHVAGVIAEKQASLVVFDTQSRFHGAPENDNTAGSVFIQALELVAKKTDAAVLAISHVGKGKDSDTSQYDRGASSLTDNARAGLKLTKLSHDLMQKLADPIVDKAMRCDIVQLTHSKNSYGPRRNDVYLERRPNGLLLPTLLTFESTDGPRPWAPTMDDFVRNLLRSVGHDEVSRNQVRDEYQHWCGPAVTRDEAVRAFDTAVDNGQLVFWRTHRNAQLYREANWDLR
jgi:Bifunctional DNA primase/polymerase, N-terminal/AAA domain